MAAKKGNDYSKGITKTLYRQEYDEIAYNYCLLGATDEDLAKFFKVSESTINNWKKSNQSFLESIKRGKEFADIEIVKSLFKRAKGYSYKEVTVQAKQTPRNAENFEGIDDEDYIPDEDKGFSTVKVTTKEIAPDTIAQMFWLKNRQPKYWRDKQEVDHTSRGEKLPTVTIFKLPDDGRND